MPATLSATPDDLWFKDAIIYEIHIKAFQDSNADGIGDFQGLIDRLDYLQHLGVTTIWLLPFYPSPQRDGGYDISDYFSINPDYGTLKQFKRLMKEAHKRGLKVITELVINHTSDQHPWFQRARSAKPGSRYRDWYVWNDSPNKYQDVRIIFQDFETSNWSWDSVAGAYYWHRFYSHQPDLNFDNEEVQQEIFRILDFWIDMGVDGFRLDAIPYLFERENTNCENLPETHQFLKKLRQHAENKKPDVMLLAEANMWPEDSAEYFGEGDECHMNYHFPIMPRMFMALKMEDRYPIIDIIDQTPDIPENCQWGMFLRNHDELTLEMVTDEERDYMYQAYNKDALSRVNLGIRHRLAPLLDNDRHKIELMNCLLFSMPGTPVLYYGDEIGMGDNVYLGDRDGVRTPMQWSPDRNAGFSAAHPHKLFLPLINDPEYHYETVNVETQRNNGSSLYWWMKRTIAIRKRFKAFGRGDIKFLTPENAKVLAFTRSHNEEHLLILANLSRHPQAAELSLPDFEGYSPREIFGQTPFPKIEAGLNRFTLGPYGYYWFVLEAEESYQSHSLPTLKKPGVKWTKLFRGQYRQEIEETILPKFLRNNSRYVVDGQILESVLIENDQKVTFGEENFILLVLKATFTEGFPERFFLPLAAQKGDELSTSLSPVFQFQTEAGQRTIFDACDLPSFQKFLLHNLLGTQKSNGKPFHVRRIRGIQAYRKREDLPTPRIAKLQNTNLCLIFDDKYFLKIFHRLGQTTNPDLEINRIAEKKALPVPGYLAHLEIDKDQHAGLVLAMLQPYIPNQGTAKQYFHDAADRYLDRIQPQGERPELEDFPWGLAATTLPVAWESILGNMPLQRAELLGRELAELHANVATQPQADFQPEAFSLHYQRSLFAAFQPLIRTVFKQLAQNRDLPGVDTLLGYKSTITEKLKQIYDHKLEAQKVRLHGDLHLEKVLFTGRDFCFFDFEGDRQRDYRKLRLRKSPAHELASLICSFHYAALDAVWQRAGEYSILEHPMLPWMEAWFAAMSQALLKGYLSLEPARKLLPEDATDRQLLLRTFMLERHLYELSFELKTQRGLSAIPLRGILRILDTAS